MSEPLKNVMTRYPLLFPFPLPANLTLRAPPVPSITFPASGCPASHVTMARRSSSGTPSERASLKNPGVSTTVCKFYYTPLEYTNFKSRRVFIARASTDGRTRGMAERWRFRGDGYDEHHAKWLPRIAHSPLVHSFPDFRLAARLCQTKSQTGACQCWVSRFSYCWSAVWLRWRHNRLVSGLRFVRRLIR